MFILTPVRVLSFAMSMREQTGMTSKKPRHYSAIGSFCLVILLFSLLVIVYYPLFFASKNPEEFILSTPDFWENSIIPK